MHRPIIPPIKVKKSQKFFFLVLNSSEKQKKNLNFCPCLKKVIESAKQKMILIKGFLR